MPITRRMRKPNSRDDLAERYGDNLNIRDFDGDPRRLTEMDALVAYLQVLGTLVDFEALDREDVIR